VREFFSGSSPNGKIMAYNGVRTSKGQSGSPIFATSKCSQYHLVGVHTGVHDTKQFGFASVITRNVQQWMANEVLQFG